MESMATETIQQPAKSSTVTDVTSSFATQQYYHIPNNDPFKFFRNNNVVTVNTTIVCDATYTSYPGTTVLSGLPAPADPVTLSIPAFGSLDTVAPLWMRVTAGGAFNLRYGTPGKAYNVNFTYICK